MRNDVEKKNNVEKNKERKKRHQIFIHTVGDYVDAGRSKQPVGIADFIECGEKKNKVKIESYVVKRKCIKRKREKRERKTHITRYY